MVLLKTCLTTCEARIPDFRAVHWSDALRALAHSVATPWKILLEGLPTWTVGIMSTSFKGYQSGCQNLNDSKNLSINFFFVLGDSGELLQSSWTLVSQKSSKQSPKTIHSWIQKWSASAGIVGFSSIQCLEIRSIPRCENTPRTKFPGKRRGEVGRFWWRFDVVHRIFETLRN